MDEFTSNAFIANTVAISEMPINKDKNTTTLVVFQSHDSIPNLMFSSYKQTQFRVHGKNVVDSTKVVLMDVPTFKHSKTNQHGLNPKKASFDLLIGTCNISYENKLLTINMTKHLFVLNVNGLLCEACHLRSTNIWKPFIPATQCGNKFVNPWPHFREFLELCNNHFDIGIWSSTTLANLKPMVDFLLRG
jgi:hypothetical protein